MANQIIGMITIIYKWAQVNNIYKGDNPAKLVKFFKNKKIKAKLFDEDRDKMLDHIEGKAFDYQPHFCACLGMHLLTGQRSADIFGLRWKPPVSDKEKDECTGWLLDNWEEVRYFKIYDMKNREEVNIFIDDRTLAILKRLNKSLYNDAHCWAVQSPFIFPQRKNQRLHANYSSYRDQLKKLNKKLDITEIQGDVQNTTKGYKKNAFTFKLARKTLGTYIDKTEGIEMASEKLNHKNSNTTREHYIVRDKSRKEINNIYRKKPAPSPWNTHAEQSEVKDQQIRLFVKNKKSK
jgi:integrase